MMSVTDFTRAERVIIGVFLGGFLDAIACVGPRTHPLSSSVFGQQIMYIVIMHRRYRQMSGITFSGCVPLCKLPRSAHSVMLWLSLSSGCYESIAKIATGR